MDSPTPAQSPIPFIRRILDTVGFDTILGRFISTAILLVTVTVLVAWLSQLQVSKSTRVNSQNQNDRVKIAQDLRELGDLLWQMETHFQSFMLVPEETVKQDVIDYFEKVQIHIDNVETSQWVRNDEKLKSQISELEANLARLHSNLIDIMQLRADPQKVFPNIGIMINELNPLNNEINGSARIALEETKELRDSADQQLVGDLFDELRYFWALRINTFRMFTSTRMGIFNLSVENSLNGSVRDMELYDVKVEAILNELGRLDKKGALGFQQSIALNDIIKNRKEWNKSFAKVKDIIMSSDGWRRDTPVMRDTINPLFKTIWQTLQEVSHKLENRAADDIGSATSLADQVSSYIWLLTLVVIVVAMIGSMVFESQIRQPIIRVIRALKAEAAGERDIVLPDTKIREARELTQAFGHMREQVHSRQEHLQAVLTYAAEAIVTTDLHCNITSFNPAATQLFGYSSAVAIGRSLQQIIPAMQKDNADLADGTEHEMDAHCADGKIIPIGLRISNMRVGNEELRLIMIADIRERRAMLDQIQARESRLRTILDNTAEAIVTFDKHCVIETWNNAAEKLFGWVESDVIGHSISDYISVEHDPDEPDGTPLCLTANIEDHLGRETEVIGQNRNGVLFPLSLKITRMLQENTVKYTALLANITERRALMEKLRKLAEHDSLTGLRNRAYFHAELERCVENFKQDPENSFALFYIDLDNFKYVNDTLGHAAGDKLLIEVSNLLNSRTRRSDLVARLGGDEFVVILHEANPQIIHTIADSFRRHLADYAFHFEGKTVDIGCSIGVAQITINNASPSDIMSQADLACHLAKRAGRNRVHVFSKQDAGDVQTMSIDIGWSRRIKQALEKNEFVLALQPIVNTRNHQTDVFEVLVRLMDADGSITMPSGFLPTAERFGLSADIDAWIIAHAIEHLAQVRQKGAHLRYAINLSGQSITSPMIADLIPQLIKNCAIEPSALTFEITETAAIADMNKAVNLLTRLRDLGCLTALDDFGSGMSSFAYLRELPVDIVKIDGRFVKNMNNSTIDQAMVKAMNEIAHALGKKTVAEFVEHEKHFQLLQEMGVDYAQGYHLGKPALIDLCIEQYLANTARDQKAG